MSEAMTVDKVSAYMKWWGAYEDANNMSYRKYAIEVAYCVSIVLKTDVLLLFNFCLQSYKKSLVFCPTNDNAVWWKLLVTVARRDSAR